MVTFETVRRGQYKAEGLWRGKPATYAIDRLAANAWAVFLERKGHETMSLGQVNSLKAAKNLVTMHIEGWTERSVKPTAAGRAEFSPERVKAARAGAPERERKALLGSIDMLRELARARRDELARMARTFRDVRIKPATDPEWLRYQKEIKEKQARLHELSVQAGEVVTAKGNPHGGARARKKASKKVAKKKTRKKAKVGRGCSTRAGEMFALERNELPDKASGLPRERKYPLYRIVGGKALADKEHAANAKARALQQLGKTITGEQYAKIVAKADRVIRLCDAAAVRRRRAAKRKKTAKKSSSKKPAKKRKKAPKRSSPLAYTVRQSFSGIYAGRGAALVEGRTNAELLLNTSPSYEFSRLIPTSMWEVKYRGQRIADTKTLQAAKRKAESHYRKMAKENNPHKPSASLPPGWKWTKQREDLWTVIDPRGKKVPYGAKRRGDRWIPIRGLSILGEPGSLIRAKDVIGAHLERLPAPKARKSHAVLVRELGREIEKAKKRGVRQLGDIQRVHSIAQGAEGADAASKVSETILETTIRATAARRW